MPENSDREQFESGYQYCRESLAQRLENWRAEEANHSIASEIKTGARMRMNTAFRSKPTSPLARRLNFFDTPPLAGVPQSTPFLFLRLADLECSRALH
jgi:hypothetical protein